MSRQLENSENLLRKEKESKNNQCLPKKKEIGHKIRKSSKIKKKKGKQKFKISKDNIQKHLIRRSKREEQEEEMIIMDGHSTVPQSILECIAEMVSQMTRIEWEALIFKATKEAATSTDTVSQIAVTLLEEYCEDDHIQTLKTISDNHCPKDMTNPQKFRMALLMLHNLGNYIYYLLTVKINIYLVCLYP
ncbi:uncharacterized protein LOC134256463 [Saccostrea cucullata]|uniref:uncharacterized protein LOC134256463 n=1 Tax=Saccostrea cuccullata TaxID=36930 RepID=UPI002ED37E68